MTPLRFSRPYRFPRLSFAEELADGKSAAPLRFKKANTNKILTEINQAKTVNDARYLIKKYLSPQLRREITRNHPEFFLLYYLGFALPPHQRKWIELWSVQFLLLLAPRDHGKSWIFSYALPLYEIYTSYIRSNLTSVDVRLLEISKIDAQSLKAMTQVRETIERNPYLMEDYGDIRDMSEWLKTHFRCKRTGDTSQRDYTLENVGVEGGVTGAHFHRMICDDIQDTESTKTLERMEAQEDWFWGTIWNLREPSTFISMIGTRKHRRDIYNTVMQKPIWKTVHNKAVIKYPMIPDPEKPGMMKQGWLYTTDTRREIRGLQDLRGEEQIQGVKLLTDDYQVLWEPTAKVDANGKPIMGYGNKPEVMGWGIETLLLDRANGPTYFDREKQNEISGLEGNLFPPDYISHFYDTQELILAPDGHMYIHA